MKFIKNNHAFTLIEMMIVLMVISILLLIAIPNMSKNNSIAQDKSCEATIDLLQAQVGAYQVEHNELPESLSTLKEFDYVETINCPNGTALLLTEEGKVEKADAEEVVATPE